MADEAQAEALRDAGRADGVLGPTYLFNTARLATSLRGCRQVLDLGCGPATQLAQLAALHPDTRFVGVDLSAAMLTQAEAHVRDLGLRNVRFVEADVTELSGVAADGDVDGVMSTLALHHLPTLDHLHRCLREVHRVLSPNGALCLIDLGRLKAAWTTHYFAHAHADQTAEIFTVDYEHSLRAAFLADDFRSAVRSCLPARPVTVRTTAGLNILVLAATPSRGLPEALGQHLALRRAALPPRQRRELDEIRLFFRLGGLAEDPFSPPRPRREARPGLTQRSLPPEES